MEKKIQTSNNNSNKVGNYPYNNNVNIDTELILFLFCLNCKIVPVIKFINLQKASVSCNCNSEHQQMTYEEILDKFCLNIASINSIISYLICIEHNDIFKFYCENCDLNLCEECRENHNCHHKYIKDVKIFNNNYFESGELLLNLDESFDALKKIIILLFKQFQKYPSYNIKQNIISLYKLNITNEENLLLEVLNLENKQYTNVDSLLQKDLGNLKELCLKGNKLNNEQIPILKNLNCHDLLKLNLESNYFTSYLLFTVVPNFNKLQEVNFSSNRLFKDIDALKNKSIPYFSIKKLNLSNGNFSDDTICSLFSLNFSELEWLDLSSNNLSSLSFIQKINFVNKKNKIKILIAFNNGYFPGDSIKEYINYLILNYVSLERLVLEDEYSIEFESEYYLPFKIICFDEGKNSSYLLDEYDKENNQNEIRLNTLPDYQKFYDNRASL